MNHVTSLDDVALSQPSMVTIGVYDGVHRGHQQLIARLVTEAHERAWKAVVVTFFPHPDVVLRNITDRYYLTTSHDRAQFLHDLGVDVIVTLPFDDAMRRMRANLFVDKLISQLRMNTLWVGQDFALGYQREGNVEFLTRAGAARGFSVHPINLVTQAADGRVISSTHIREMLLAGQVVEARDWLGRSYSVSGTVVEGDKRGRTIGFPTANLEVWDQLVIPAKGVYAGYATVRGQRYAAVTNIGTRPTFDGQSVRVEPHLLNFDGDIYGETLLLTFEARLRDEQKFNDTDALKTQLAHDVQMAQAILT